MYDGVHKKKKFHSVAGKYNAFVPALIPMKGMSVGRKVRFQDCQFLYAECEACSCELCLLYQYHVVSTLESYQLCCFLLLSSVMTFSHYFHT